MIPTTAPTRPKVSTMTDSAKSGPTPAGSPTPNGAPEPPAAVDVAVTAEDRIRTFLADEHRRVVATVSLWSGSADDANEAVTDAVGTAWERLARGKSIENLAAWVTRVAMNRVRSRHRHRDVARRKRHLIAVVEGAEDRSGAQAAHLDLRRAVGELTERQQHVVALYYGLDRTITEIAADLGLAPGTIKATLHQARDRLSDSLDSSAAKDL